MAHKKGAGSTKNGRDSNGKRLGVKCFGSQITLNRVLLINDENQVLVGKPYLENVTVEGKILQHLRDRKKIVYKMRPKKKTRKKQGHRQQLTRILIDAIKIQ